MDPGRSCKCVSMVSKGFYRDHRIPIDNASFGRLFRSFSWCLENHVTASAFFIGVDHE